MGKMKEKDLTQNYTKEDIDPARYPDTATPEFIRIKPLGC